MNDIVLSENQNWVFVSFVKGAFGHLLARTLTTSPDSVWYDHPINGKHPWDWCHFGPSYGSGVSPSHHGRVFNSSPLQEIIGFGAWDEWYAKATPEHFSQPWLLEKLENYKLIYATHDTPNTIRKHFPNSKIIMIDISDDDWVAVVKNQIEKTGSYIAWIDKENEHHPLQNKKIEWNRSTGETLLRDWEKYHNNLPDDVSWIKWTADTLKTQMEHLRANSKESDAIFHSRDRFNVNAITKLHSDVGLAYDEQAIQQVLDSFNLDTTIKKFL